MIQVNSRTPRFHRAQAPFVPLLSVLALLVPAAHAQRGTRLSPQAANLLNHLADLHAGVTSLRARLLTETLTPGGWVRTEQDFQFAAPDRLRLTTIATGDPLQEKTISVSAGRESYLLSAHTPIVKRWQRNLLLDWGNMTGGPANVAGFGANYAHIKTDYRARTRGGDTVLDRPTTRLVLTAKNAGRTLVKDFVNTDSTKYWTQFAVFKVPRYLRPEEIQLWIDTERGTVLKREHYFGGRLRLRATATATRQLLPGLYFPTRWEVTDGEGVLIERYTYTDLQVNPKLAGDAFAVPVAPHSVVEDAEPAPVTVYRQQVRQKPDAPSPRYNLILALVHDGQDYVGALDELTSFCNKWPDVPAGHLEKARLLMFVGRPDRAAGEYAAVQKQSPTCPVALPYAAALMETEHNRQAAKVLAGSSLLQTSSQALNELARAELRDDRPEVAARHLLAAVKIPGAANAPGRIAAARRLVMLSRFQYDGTWLKKQLAEIPPGPVKSLLEGDLALAAGNAGQAVQGYQRCAREAGDDGLLRYTAARALLNAGFAPQARPFLEQLAAVYPADAFGLEVRQLLAAACLAQRDFAAALAAVSPALASLPGEAAAGRQRRVFRETAQKLFLFQPLRDYLGKEAGKPRGLDLTGLRVLGEMETETGDWQGAVQTYGALIRRFGTRVFLLTELAKAQFAIADRQAKAAGQRSYRGRRYKAGIRTLEQATRADSQQPYYWQLYVAWLDRWFRQYEASKVLKRKLAENPLDSDTHIVKASVRPPEGFTKPQPVIDELERALALSHSPGPNRYEEMLFARQLLANAYERAGRGTDAAAQYKTVLLSSPDPGTRIKLRHLAAVCFVRTHQYDALLSLARDLVHGRFEPEERLAYFTDIARLCNTGKADATNLVQYLQQQLDAHSKDPVLLQLVGEIDVRRRALPEAIRAYRSACDAALSDAAAWRRLAELQSQARQRQATLTSLKNAVTAGPHDSRLRRLYAVALARAKRVEEALKEIGPMMLNSTGDHRAYTAWADVQSACGKHQEAVRTYRLALRLAQYDVRAVFQETAAIQMKLAGEVGLAGDPAGAAKEFALLTLPPQPLNRRLAALFRQCHWLTAAGDLPTAKQCMNQVLQLTTDRSVRQAAQRVLSNLEKK